MNLALSKISENAHIGTQKTFLGTDFGRLFQMQNLGNSLKFIFSDEPLQNISLISLLKFCVSLIKLY